MNTNSNTYTFLYAAIMVVIVAALLSFAAFSLQPQQDKNIRIEKFQKILASVKIASTPENAEELYAKYITSDFVVGVNGEMKEGKGFDVNLKPQVKLMYEAKALQAALKSGKITDAQAKLDEIYNKRDLPLFTCNKEDGEFLIIPVQGKGLWGPIWGYVSMQMDYNTIYGVVFDHKGETPGLGADIDKEWFQAPFVGKHIFGADGHFVGINVYKGGAGSAALAGDNEHGVDAISGGTITSKGLEAMLKDCLVDYSAYFKKQQSNTAVVTEEEIPQDDTTQVETIQ